MSDEIAKVHEYHDGTKHHFHRFARSLGFLDWASQPRPFRSFAGATALSLYPAPDAPPAEPPPGNNVTYDRMFAGDGGGAIPVAAASIGSFLRYALGLSAWKAFRGARWSLRVNPSSGNLHPTEAYFITGAIADLGEDAGVWHYAPDRHVIERRCAFAPEAWPALGIGEPHHAFFVALTSIHWREAWKYGERALGYCQHDVGHAVAALRLSAALCGWQLAILPSWPRHAVAALAGLDRDEDYVEAEREEPACLMLVTGSSRPLRPPQANPGFVDAVRRGRWFGQASQLSEDHVEWTFIDEVARATGDGARADREADSNPESRIPNPESQVPGPESQIPNPESVTRSEMTDRGVDARALLLQRRSAVALDGVSSTDRATFMRLLSRVVPGRGAPWDALWWSPRIHLALFVHRVTGVEPGLYLLAREPAAVSRLRAAFDPGFLWEPVAENVPLWLLQRGDYRARARRLSCDQDIAADGFFSLGMIADFERSLVERGPSFYRPLFWESGVVGQMLYLEAEAAGARSTGIGCFYDDPVHELLGLAGHAFQSLYHFTVGMPVDDARLTTEPGYAWEGTW